MSGHWLLYGVRAGLVVLAICLWWWTQALLAKRVPKPGSDVPLTDGIHRLTARWHARLFANERQANLLLVLSSGVIDLLGFYLLGASIFGSTVRPFLGLFLVFALRQVCQVLCPLPPPEGMIWRDPGVPSALVTYGTSTDLFFSGHTSIAVLGAAVLAGNFGTVGLTVGIVIALFEIVTVLVLRAHYTMDVFTGIIAALWVYSVSGQVAPAVDRWLSMIG